MSVPWLSGYYKNNTSHFWVTVVNDQNVKLMNLAHVGIINDDFMPGTWNFGSFGQTHVEVQKATGKTNYDIEMVYANGAFKQYGVLHEDKKTITIWGFYGYLEELEWTDEQGMEKLKDSRDSADNMPCPYPLQPQKQGKLVWLSGTPGAGKSTSGLILSQQSGFVFYEADTFLLHVNPYIPKDATNPAKACAFQNPLKNLGLPRIKAVQDGNQLFQDLSKGSQIDLERSSNFYTHVALNVKSEKERIGGNWIVAQAVPKRSLRDLIRKVLGPDLVFVLLNLTKETQKQRIEARNGGDDNDNAGITDWIAKMYDQFEGKEDDEPGTFSIDVTADMTQEQVVNQILSLI